MIDKWMTFLAVCLAVSSVSLSVTKATVSAPLRNWISKRSKFFGKLFGCPYCFSHWVSAAFVVPFADKLVLTDLGTCIDIIIAIFAMVTVSCIIAGFVIKAFSEGYEE